MNEPSKERESVIASTFVELVDSHLHGFGPTDVLNLLTTRCVDVVGASGAGVVLVDGDGQMRVATATASRVERLIQVQVDDHDGAFVDCLASGCVAAGGNGQSACPAARFRAESARAGFPAVCVLPLRVPGRVLGCLSVFLARSVPLSGVDVSVVQSLADVAAVVIVHDQSIRAASVREDHLRQALTSRIEIEQAKGMIAERNGVDMDVAFSQLRGYARNHNRRLAELAHDLATGNVRPQSLIQPSHDQRSAPLSSRAGRSPVHARR